MDKQFEIFIKGLADAYKIDMNKKQIEISNLENKLDEYSNELKTARSESELDKTELSNLEGVRRDLVAQRELLTNELNDSDLKGNLLYFLFEFII